MSAYQWWTDNVLVETCWGTPMAHYALLAALAVTAAVVLRRRLRGQRNDSWLPMGLFLFAWAMWLMVTVTVVLAHIDTHAPWFGSPWWSWSR